MITMLMEAENEAIRTLIAAALIKFASGIIAIWGTVNIYFFSYLKHQGETITPTTNSIILLCSVIPSALAMLSSTTLSRWFGYRRVIKACGILFASVPFIINVKLNPFLLGFCYQFIPISCLSISAVPVLNCLWSHFSNHLNKVSGAAVLFFSLGTVTFNLIFALVVNPNNQQAIINAEGQAFFSTEVANNIFKASNIIFFVSGISYMVGAFLISKKGEEFIEQQNNSQLQLHQLSPPPELQEIDQKQEQLASTDQSVSPKEQKFHKTLLDKKFLILFGISYLIPQYLVYLILEMKLIFMPIVNDDHYLASCAVVLTVATVIGAPFWGYVGDHKGFKFTLLIIIICDTVVKILGLFCKQKWNIILLYFMLSFNDKGIYTIIGPGLIQIFGLQTATQLIPFKGLAIFLVYITVPAFQLIFSGFLSYLQILTIFLSFTIIAFFLSIHFYKKIEYTNKIKPEVLIQNRQFQENDVDNYLP